MHHDTDESRLSALRLFRNSFHKYGVQAIFYALPGDSDCQGVGLANERTKRHELIPVDSLEYWLADTANTKRVWLTGLQQSDSGNYVFLITPFGRNQANSHSLPIDQNHSKQNHHFAQWPRGEFRALASGMLGFKISIRELLDNLYAQLNYLKESSEFACVVGSHGVLLHTLPPILIGKHVSSGIDNVYFSPQQLTFEFLKKQATGHTVVKQPVFTKGDSSEQVIGWRSVNLDDVVWYVTFHRPYDLVVADVQKALRGQILLGLLLILVVLGTAFYVLQVRHRESLAEARAIYYELFEKTPDALFLLNEKGQYLHANPTALALTGYQLEELCQKSVSNLLPPAPPCNPGEASITALERMNGNGKVRAIAAAPDIPGAVADARISAWITVSGSGRETEILTKQETAVPVELNVSRINYQGRPALLSVARDLTERKRNQKALEESQQKFRELATHLTNTLNATSDGILVVNYLPKGETITLANARYGEIFGIDHHAIIGQLHETVLAETKSCFKEPEVYQNEVRRLYGDREEAHFCELELVKPQARTLERWSGPVRDAQGAIVGRIWSFRDVTNRKQLELQLWQAQKLESIGRLAGGVAHDFNNILTGIRGYVELAKMSLCEHEPLYQDLHEVGKCTERASELTQQLLAFSRRQVIQPRVINLADLIQEHEKMLCRLIGEDIELRTATAPNLWNIRVDPGQMSQIIFNLAVNARDAMPDGGKLTISASNAELREAMPMADDDMPSGRYVLLTISDTGVGMDADTKSHLFEPFFTTKEKSVGTGLGLATVYGIVKQHGGYISVQSEFGLGTTFGIYFPEVKKRAEKTSTVAAPHLPRGNETILLVEDEASVRAATQRVLASFGYHVLVADNGTEAQRMFAANAVEIAMLITDVIMPGQNGRALACKLLSQKQNLRVLFISGYTDDAIAYHGVLEDGIDYLPKPFTPLALCQKVREILDRGKKFAN
jgi:signal transduction histidine kinase/CheY-like chemotaxis protein